MSERNGAATFLGNPLTLVGDEVKVGDKAPDFELLKNDLSSAAMAEYAGKVVVLLMVPSLDTPVCDTEVRRFNSEAAALGDDVAILAVSMDLPFAQGRWCGSAGVEAVETLSGHRDTAMGEAYGALVKELRLLSRVVLVVGKDGVVSYVQYVKEISEEPDYDAALAAVKAAVA